MNYVTAVQSRLIYSYIDEYMLLVSNLPTDLNCLLYSHIHHY